MNREEMLKSERRSAALMAMAPAIIASTNRSALLELLRVTGASSADDRDDDLCRISAVGPLSGAQIAQIEGRGAAWMDQIRSVFGDGFDKPVPWNHSWTRRRVRRGGEFIVLPYEEWLNENATCILRAGAVAVRLYAGKWVRLAHLDDAHYFGVALDAVNRFNAARERAS